MQAQEVRPLPTMKQARKAAEIAAAILSLPELGSGARREALRLAADVRSAIDHLREAAQRADATWKQVEAVNTWTVKEKEQALADGRVNVGNLLTDFVKGVGEMSPTSLTTADVDLLFGHAVMMRKLGHEDLPEAFADLAARIASTLPDNGDGEYVRKAWEAAKERKVRP